MGALKGHYNRQPITAGIDGRTKQRFRDPVRLQRRLIFQGKYRFLNSQSTDFSIRKVQIFNSQSTDFQFAKYRFSIRKVQISIRKVQIFNSQSTDFQFAKYRFSIRKVHVLLVATIAKVPNISLFIQSSFLRKCNIRNLLTDKNYS